MEHEERVAKIYFEHKSRGITLTEKQVEEIALQQEKAESQNVDVGEIVSDLEKQFERFKDEYEAEFIKRNPNHSNQEFRDIYEYARKDIMAQFDRSEKTILEGVKNKIFSAMTDKDIIGFLKAKVVKDPTFLTQIKGFIALVEREQETIDEENKRERRKSK